MLRLCASIENLRAELDVFFEKTNEEGFRVPQFAPIFYNFRRRGVAPKGAREPG